MQIIVHQSFYLHFSLDQKLSRSQTFLLLFPFFKYPLPLYLFINPPFFIIMSTSSTPHPNHKTQFHRQQSASDAGSVGGGGEANSFVQRNTVQNQFAALSADRNRFAQEVEEANNELKVVQKEHKAIKVGRDDLFKQNRQAQEILGETKARLGMLKERKARIAQMTENESRAIHNCANHSKTVRYKRFCCKTCTSFVT